MTFGGLATVAIVKFATELCLENSPFVRFKVSATYVFSGCLQHSQENVVLFIALINVALGFALAVWLAREKVAEDELDIVSALGPQDPREVMERYTPAPPTGPVRGASLPAEWVNLLDDLAKRNPLVAAAIDILKLDVGEYRDQLVTLDYAVRCHRHGAGDRPIGEVVKELTEVNARWLDEKARAMESLLDTSDPMGEFEPQRHQLVLILEEQAAQFETVLTSLAGIDVAEDVSDGCPQLLGEIRKLLAMAHAMRDSIHETLTSVFGCEKQIDVFPQKLLVDSLTGLYDRIGLEAVAWEWWQDDPTRQRQVSIALVDIDHFDDLNERFGPITGDQVLFAVAQLLRDAIRDERGYDVATRYSGQQFVLFFGDTAPRNAVTAMERIRKIVEESEVQLGETKIRLTVSAGVTPILQADNTTTLMTRAAGAVAEAKSAGRNCIRIDEGDGPCEMKSPDLAVNGRTVLLEV